MARMRGRLADTEWQRALVPFQRRLEADAPLPAIQGPRWVFEALGGESPLIDDLCAASGLFYAYLDLADDVEDGELPEGWESEAVAQNAAQGVLFHALQLVQQLDQQAGLQGQMLAAFLAAGAQLTWGQDRDLRNQDPGPQAVLTTIEAKTGRSLQLYCLSAALLAGAAPPIRELVAEFGLCWGMVTQLVGDWWDIWQKPHSPDLANRRRTFPVAWALAGPKGERVRLQLDTPLQDPLAQTAMRFRLEALGADRAVWRVVAHYRERAKQALSRAGLDSAILLAQVNHYPPASPAC